MTIHQTQESPRQSKQFRLNMKLNKDVAHLYINEGDITPSSFGAKKLQQNDHGV